MTPRGISGFTALVLSFATLGSVSACGDDKADGGSDDAGSGGDDTGTGGTAVAGTTATGGSAARGGTNSIGGTSSGGSTSGGGSGLATGTGGTNNAAGAPGKGGGPATGGTANAGGSGSMNGGSGASGPPGGNGGNSPYEIACHGDTAMCGNPAALMCLGLRIGTEVLGYSCTNECQSEADCSTKPSTTDAAAGCIDFVNKKYCMLVCKDGDEQASCPTGMYCYVYEGTPTGYCLWH